MVALVFARHDARDRPPDGQLDAAAIHAILWGTRTEELQRKRNITKALSACSSALNISSIGWSLASSR